MCVFNISESESVQALSTQSIPVLLPPPHRPSHDGRGKETPVLGWIVSLPVSPGCFLKAALMFPPDFHTDGPHRGILLGNC